MSVSLPVTLDEFKKHLNLDAGFNVDDAELTLHLGAATEAIEARVGPLVVHEVTQRIRVRRELRRHYNVEQHHHLLTLNEAPVVDVTSITNVIAGVPTAIAGLDIDQLDIDLDAAIIDLGYYFRGASRVFEVTYTAGRGTIDTLPDRFKVAVMIVAEQLWETQRGTGVRPQMFGIAAETTAASSHAANYIYRGYALPSRALELIANDLTVAFS